MFSLSTRSIVAVRTAVAIEAVRRFEHCKGDLRIMPKALHHMTLEELSNSFHNPDTVKVDSARAVRPGTG